MTDEALARAFGPYLRGLREAKQASDKGYSLRKVAEKVGVAPGTLSRIEQGDLLPGEGLVFKLAGVLDEDPDVMLAAAGRVARDLQEIICKRPKVFGEMLRQLRNAPDHAILKVVRVVRDGKW